MPTETLSARPLPPAYRFAPLVVFAAATVYNFATSGDRRFEDDADSLVTAAGYAFSIWGVIFLGLLGFSVVLALGREPDTPPLRRAVLGLGIAGLASIAFVPISIGGDQVFGFLDVALHLVALVYAYGQLRAHVRLAPDLPRGQRFWFYGPSMYLGWISAATVIAASLALEQLGFRVSVQVALVLALVLAFVLFAVGRTFLRQADAVVALTVAWALVGVAVEQVGFDVLQWVCYGGAATIVIAWLLRVSRGGYGFYATPGYYSRARPAG